MTGRKTSYEVGDVGPFHGRIVWKRGNRYAEALRYRNPPGKLDVFIYRVGPRGGVSTSHAYTDPERLRREASTLFDIARKAEERDDALPEGA